MKIQQSFRHNENSKRQGNLYLIATPIGNLEDMTLRGLRILKEADWIAAEDTRHTRKLLAHYHIEGRMLSYHEHNKKSAGQGILTKLRDGFTVALVSDAGMPGISDPGYELVREAAKVDIPVIPVPGANAALSALIISGLDTKSFLFSGFLPRETRRRNEKLEQLTDQPHTLIFYESPHRLKETLKAMQQCWGNRQIVIARELTKTYEEVLRSDLVTALSYVKEVSPKGEYCLIVQGADDQQDKNPLWWSLLSLKEHYEHYVAQGLNRKEAMKQVAQDRGVSKREIYNRMVSH